MSRIAWLAGGGLIALYAVNVAANSIYKAATDVRVELLQERIVTLSRVDRNHPDIGQMQKLIAQSGFSNFTTLIATAIARRATLAEYLNTHPHIVIGLVVDGKALTDVATKKVLTRMNQRLKPHKVSVGLSQPIVRLSIPEQATREDILRGITTVLRTQPDLYLALTSHSCRYTEVRRQSSMPTDNRVYSFGLRKLVVVDNAVLNEQLSERVLTELANFLVGSFKERRWSKADYAQKFESVLKRRKVLGRVVREPTKPPAPDDKTRSVPVVIGLDNIAPREARSYIQDINLKFKEFGIRFAIKKLYQHRLKNSWKWPLEVQRMQKSGEGELFILLTPDEWISPKSGHVRGLGSSFFGAIIAQVGTRQQTIQRLMHEIGHQFGLPHTLQAGAVMYPNEEHIGFNWSPGNRRRLKDNRLSATWHSSKTYRDRFEISIRTAPLMIRSGSDTSGEQPGGPSITVNRSTWVACNQSASQ